MSHLGDQEQQGLGIISLIMAAVGAGAQVYGKKQEESAAKAAQKEADKLARLNAIAANKAQKSSEKRWRTVAVVGGIVGVLAVGAWAFTRRK